MADDVIGQLGGFALGEVLSSLDLGLDVINNAKRGLGVSTTSAFSRDSIYAGKFVDDADDDDDDENGYDPATDLEAQVDREMYSEKYSRTGNANGKATAGGGTKSLLRGEEEDFDDDDDEEEDQPMSLKQEDEEERYRGESADPIPLPPMRQINVKELFPKFEYGQVLDFTDLFSARPRKKPRIDYEPVKLTLPLPEELHHSRSTRDALIAPLKPIPRDARMRSVFDESQQKVRQENAEAAKHIADQRRQATKSRLVVDESTNVFDMAELDDWETRIVWDLKEAEKSSPSGSEDLLAPRNAQFESGDWVDSIIWDSNKSYREFSRLNLNMNDTRMVLEVENPAQEATRVIPTIQIAAREAGLDPFNLSNDRAYEVAKETKKRIRQTLGQLEVQHAYPAQKLQLPFYKTRLNKDDARSFHRPPIRFPANIPVTFTKLRSKKKKDKSGRKIKKSDGEALRTTSDISLRDTATFCLWEYSEENPPIISNIGMGSVLVNYYRKLDATDDFVPKLEVGEPFLLEFSDESPFKQFGVVDPGQTVSSVYNNLIRAPLFRQEAYPTDFLVVRSTIAGDTKYYIRDIKHTFVVGQTYPLQEVPGPHSRKNTNLNKLRLQSMIFRIMAKNPNKPRLKVNQLTRYFPEQNDLQMRQRLKEFMEYNRKEPDQGYWTLKRSFPVPDENELMKLATPELVCLTESMQVGHRHLLDAGYGQVEEGVVDDMTLDIEQQLAPWITTKNFISASSSKAMLKLFGEGDPTGRGEAFSFLRVSMKDIFLRDGELMSSRLATMENRPKSAHRYNVQEQQDVYKEEIVRIWRTQQNSLSSPIEPELTQEDEDRFRGRGKFKRADTPDSNAGTPRGQTPGSRASSPVDDAASNASGGRAGGQNKVLRIKRLVAGKWEVEIVRDPTIITTYLRQRQLIEEDALDPDDLMPTDDVGKNERRMKRLKEQVDKLKRNQERRMNRQHRAAGGVGNHPGITSTSTKPIKPETTRICGNCGQRGHMKTSRKLCPRWAEFNGGLPGAKPGAAGPGSTTLPLAPSGSTTLPLAPPAVSPPKPSVKFTIGANKPAIPSSLAESSTVIFAEDNTTNTLPLRVDPEAEASAVPAGAMELDIEEF